MALMVILMAVVLLKLSLLPLYSDPLSGYDNPMSYQSTACSLRKGLICLLYVPSSKRILQSLGRGDAKTQCFDPANLRINSGKSLL